MIYSQILNTAVAEALAIKNSEIYMAIGTLPADYADLTAWKAEVPDTNPSTIDLIEERVRRKPDLIDFVTPDENGAISIRVI